MSTRAQAERILTELGLELDPDSGKQGLTWSATIDAAGRRSFAGDCRGHVVYDFTATAAEFWAEVIREARELAPLLADCPHPEGECEFHDEEGEP